jgi:hypothetical protein
MKIKEAIQEHMIDHLLNLCMKELELDHLPKIVLLTKSPTVDSGNSFGEFDGESIKVVAAGRHPMDVCRTLAHELVHWKQRSENMDLDGADGSDIENQANAIAGVVMRKFGKLYPDYFVNSVN